jgi:hypothetical protein
MGRLDNMPREIPAQASGNMKNKMGLEMSLVLGTVFGTFSTKETPGAKGVVLNIGDCSLEEKGDSLGSSGRVSVSLADTDGLLKLDLDVLKLEGSEAIIWQRFEGAEDAQIILMRGSIRGPIQWEEGNRIFSFAVESDIWEDQIGFSPTEDDFPDLNPDVYGTPWPLLFGTVYHVPAVHVKKRAAGTLHTDLKLWADPVYRLSSDKQTIFLDIDVHVKTVFNSAEEFNTIYVKGGKNFTQNIPISIIIDGVVFKGTMVDEKFSVTQANAPKYEDLVIDSRVTTDPDFKNSSVLWLKKLANGSYPNILNHHCYFKTAANLVWYNYCTKQSGGKCWFRNRFISPVNNDSQIIFGDPTKSKGKELLMATGKIIGKVYQISQNGFIKDVEALIAQTRENVKGRAIVPNKSPWGLVIATLNRIKDSSGGFWRASSDTEVREYNTDPDIYVFSGIECSQILGVYGKQNVQYQDGKQKKVFKPIPKSFYTEQLESNYKVNKSFASALLFPQALKDFKTPEGSEEWGDQIYVSAISTIGPNTVDIIEWLLTTYTDLNIGKTFKIVKANLTDFPSNFAVFDRQDVLRLCEDIAWQARCALLTDSGTAELVFLAKKPTSDFEFNLTNTEFRSLKLYTTDSSNVKTKFIGVWTPNYEDTNVPNKTVESKTKILRDIVRGINEADDHRTRTATQFQLYSENVDKYGEKTEEYRFTIYDNPHSVDLGLSFWGHRFANSWKIIELNGFHDSLHLTVFDGVNLNLPGIPAVRGVIKSASFNPKEKTVSYVIWLPVLAGRIGEDSLAWQE